MKKDDPDGKGTYIIIMYRNKSATIEVGSLGCLQLKKGFYAYVGSAFSKNGLKNRVGRHIRSKKTIKWHIDYLKPAVREVWVSDYGERLECEWATALSETASDQILGFGCTDCKCKSHLFYFKSVAVLKNSQKELCKNNHLKRRNIQLPFDLKSEPVQLPKVFKLANK